MTAPDQPSAARTRSVVTIGTFDGVHRGHQALVRRAMERAAAYGSPDAVGVKALVFDPNPIEILRPAQAPARLTSFEQKRELLLAAGADEVVRLEPTAGLLQESPEEFLAIIQREHGVVGVVEGPDFRFGRARAGDVEMLARLGRSMGFACDVVEPVTVVLNDHTVAPARSTMVRWLLGHGRVADAARVLGRPHTLRGVVVRGDRRGRTIGYPTANLETPCLAPADGVYAGLARLADGRCFAAAISVGTKPTFGEHQRAVEAVFLDHAANPHTGRTESAGSSTSAGAEWHPLPGLAEYGWPVDLELHAWIREQLRFDGLQPLLDQMRRDCRLAAELIALRTSRTAPSLLETVA